MTTTSPAPVLSMTGVSKRFGAVQALKDIEFSVEAGEVVALVGDNGAGKSTLVKAIAGVYTPDEGQVVFVRHTLPGERVRAVVTATTQSQPRRHARRRLLRRAAHASQ